MEMIVKNEKLKKWVNEIEQMCTPDKVHWCDGSKKEYNELMAQAVKSGSAVKLKKRKTVFVLFPSFRCGKSGEQNLYKLSLAN